MTPFHLKPGRWSALLIVAGLVVCAATASAQVRFDRGGVFEIGRAPSSVAMADIDQDGVLDILVTNGADNRLSLFLGRVDPVTRDWLGTRVDERTGRGEESGGGYGGGGGGGGGNDGGGLPGFSTDANPVDVTTADMNSDGVPDVAVAHRIGASVSLRLGVRAGSLGSASRVPIPDRPRRLRASHVDDDGLVDLVVTCDDDVYVIFGTTNAGLPNPTPVRTPNAHPLVGADVGDVNGDGLTDLIVLSEGPGASGFPSSGPELYVFYGNGAGTFLWWTRVPMDPTIRVARDVRAVDLDLDGTSEIVVSCASARIVVVSDDGRRARSIPTGDDAGTLAVADVDGDRIPDLVTSNLGAGSSFSVLLGTGAGGFEPPIRVQSGMSPQKLAIGDLDRDARADVVIPTEGFDSASPGAFELYFDRSGPFLGAGTVNAGRGPIVDVLFVNDSSGGLGRRVTVPARSRLAVFLNASPAASDPVPFVVFAWTGVNPLTAASGFDQPFGAGRTCFPTPLNSGSPQPVFAWHTAPDRGFGLPGRVASDAPCFLVDRPAGVSRPATVYLQGIIADPGSAGEKRASVTNGVLLEVR